MEGLVLPWRREDCGCRPEDAYHKTLRPHGHRHARPEQLAPGSPCAALDRPSWRTWLALAGRGWGKTRTGVEWIKERVAQGARHIIICGATSADVRDVIIEGESGLLRCYAKADRPDYKPTRRRVTWPNGARAILLSAEDPETFRGKQGDTVLADELAAWPYPESWDNLQFTMRLGSPRFMVATTPRPTRLIRSLLSDPRTVVTRGSTFDNADNLAEDFITDIRSRYEGTRLGRQELMAEILEDHEGALWKRAAIDAKRVNVVPELARVLVAIDPAVSSAEGSDETGIVVAGTGWCDCRGPSELHGFVLEDRSGKHTPDEWAREAVRAYERNKADRIVAEINNGGALVEANLRTVGAELSYLGVHAAQAKRTRAEPVAALYEQGRVHHVGAFPQLEDQLCSWDPLGKGRSPDRLDALVWALSELMLAPLAFAGTLSETSDWMDDR